MFKTIKSWFKPKEEVWSFKFPEEQPEFYELFDRVNKALCAYIIEYDIYDTNSLRLYLGMTEYKIYENWFYNYACFYRPYPELKDKICGLRIVRTLEANELTVGAI